VGSMLDKLRGKLAKGARRADLCLSDFRLLDNTAANVLYGFDKAFGLPRAEDLQAALVRDFDGKVVPVITTARVYPDEGVVKVIASMNMPTRRFEDHVGMIAVASTMFIDQEMCETWSVVEGADGNKFLQRVTEESIGDILNERKRRMTVQASSSANFSNGVDAGVPNVGSGDKVKFYGDGQLQSGEVMEVTAQGVAIKGATGNFVVAPEAVLDLTEISAEKSADMSTRLYEYFRQIYGDEYAAKLVRQ
jgi:hypothetical protein